jgi:hypothetical protein
MLCSWQVLKEVFNFYYSTADLLESLFECLNWMHFNCALLLFWERAGSERDGARENVGSLLDLGTAAVAHFCQSVLYPAQIIFR